jgi:hypothetical protein
MPGKDILESFEKYVDPFRVVKGKGFQLTDFDPADTRGFDDKVRQQISCRAAQNGSRGSKTCSMHRIAGHCSLFSTSIVVVPSEICTFRCAFP